MRIAVGSIMHESNTFTHITTPIEDFAPILGDAVFESAEWMGETAAGGIIQTLQSQGVTVVPTLFADALPSGVVETQAYERMRDQMLERIAGEKALDGVCLALHGSMYVEGYDDPEGDLLRRVREIVGPNLPIVCALDMHATITETMLDAVDGWTAYKTAPHTDKFDTGVRAARLLLKALREGVSLVCHSVRLPILISGEQSETDAEPMAGIIRDMDGLERMEGIYAASCLLGFPWADSPHASVAVVIVGDKERQHVVREKTMELAQKIWDLRHDFTFTTEAYPLDEALDVALADPRRPIVISDSGDNPTAGASEDLSIVLKRLIERQLDDVLVAVIVDPEAMASIVRAGEGATVDVPLGRTEYAFDAPKLNVSALVRRIAVVDGVQNAVLEIQGVVVVVTDIRVDVTDPGYLTTLGLDPEAFKIVVVKSGYLSPAYQNIAARKILALTPGDTNVVLSQLPYRKVPRPIFPLDPETPWSARADLRS